MPSSAAAVLGDGGRAASGAALASGSSTADCPAPDWAVPEEAAALSAPAERTVQQLVLYANIAFHLSLQTDVPRPAGALVGGGLSALLSTLVFARCFHFVSSCGRIHHRDELAPLILKLYEVNQLLGGGLILSSMLQGFFVQKTKHDRSYMQYIKLLPREFGQLSHTLHLDHELASLCWTFSSVRTHSSECLGRLSNFNSCGRLTV